MSSTRQTPSNYIYYTSNSRRGGRSGVLEIIIYSFWGTCSAPCARPCAFILFISCDFPFIPFSFSFFIFFFTFIFFFIFSFSFHRHHHRQAGALAGAVDVEDLAVIHSLLFYFMQRKRKRNAAQRNTSEILSEILPKFFRNWGSGGGVLGGARSHAPAPGPGDMPSTFRMDPGHTFPVLDQREIMHGGVQWT